MAEQLGNPRGRRSGEAWRRTAHTLRRSPGLARLATVRFASQFGDGMFQAALGGAILFNPERETDPLAIAAGFAVLLLPYSVIGPYAGALLDRWDRRTVLLWANVIRGVLILVTAALLGSGAGEFPILLLALAAIGVSRFVLAGVSAALPRVVHKSWLVATNSVLTTTGSVVSALGATTSVAIIGVAGAGDRGSGIAVAAAAVGSAIAALAASRFHRRLLGPHADERADYGVIRAVASGLRNGAVAVWQSPGVTTAMIGIGTHRIVFGANTLIMVLVLRDTSRAGSLPGGLAGFGVAVGATAAGMLLAAISTPFTIPRIGRSRTITTALILALAAQTTLVATLTQASLLWGALVLGFAGQSIKLSGDAAMQIDIEDDRRGQVFALQDTVFNVAFIASIAAAALVIAPDGRSLGLVLAGSALYALGLVAALLNTRRARP
ncbi:MULTISPECIES: MFS transporter [Rhodococcus]|uniref:MFS transporter n=1 Tax=Rhodococcus oxybenzonivorans TaxID=1990687 RepID=A0AAE5A8P1_9NOCA|nr:MULTISPECIES: MFS transporter [Rhodococcus]MDV7246021.1 MFS transporter [Rhodococcus oxybenzonivorans]MDV7267741.1 MFS transporter [Rhodococcus oxybenzonivorans]MDV7277616.1 MFS transporter [Rhodococcus oxybenzonivorans]MDV7337034.1 MFS transporter [Rhodococcus oxybenzonivorans]MDV7347372.1 MFS transporter [Rhodococcus oxybenzonivorans]